MSLILLIDGYNIVAPVAAPGRRPDPAWLHRERQRLLDRLASHLDDALRSRCCVVFDSSRRSGDLPDRFDFRSIDVRFATDHPEADDLLEELIAAHSAPKRLAVVSSDHRVQSAANRRGATAFDAQPWLDDLLAGRLRLAPAAIPVSPPPPGECDDTAGDEKPDGAIRNDDVRGWMEAFGFDPPAS